jgi:hypothetical protein
MTFTNGLSSACKFYYGLAAIFPKSKATKAVIKVMKSETKKSGIILI